MGKGSNSPPSSSVTTQTSLPAYAQPYFTNLMQQGQALSQNGYSPYPGQQVQGFTPQQTQGFSATENLPQTYQGNLSQANNLYNTAAQVGFNAQNYTPGTIASTYQAPSQTQGQINPQQVQGQPTWNQNTAQQYMDPYTQQVTNQTLNQIQQQGQLQGQQINAQAMQQGAFGGDRNQVSSALNNYYTQQTMAQQQAAGGEQAYLTGQQQFNTQNQLAQQAGLANQQAGLQGQIAGGQLGLGYGQLANQQATTAAQLQQQAQIANTQAQQQALGLGIQGANLGLQAGQGQTWLGSTGESTGLANIQALEQSGASQQGLGQQSLNTAYNNYLSQLQWPYQQLGFESSLLYGTPVGSVGTSSTYQNPSTTSQLLGLGIGGLGAAQLGSSLGVV